MKLFGALFFVISAQAWANPFIYKHPSNEVFLKIEVLKNRGLHFELTKNRPAQDRIWTSPMILENPGLATTVRMNGTQIKNEDFEVSVNPENLCVTVVDLKQSWDIVTTCPHNLSQPWKGLAVYTNDKLNAYGLGAYYQNPGSADGDWVGRVWDPGMNTLGNALRGFSGGAQSYAMFPVLYVQGSGTRNYMILYDNVYKQMWSMNQHPWKIESFGDEVRWFIFTDNTVKELRQKFMEITGKSPVPPKAAFGMWLSEFGYENWGEVYEEVNSMHANKMPVDGVALDLQWFGGDFYMGDVDRSGSRFGTLSFDLRNFGNPKETIAHLKNERGVEVMTIEESYISQWLGEFRDLDSRGFMARNCHNMASTILTANPWWGIGGMIDWTNPDAGLFWHNTKRQKLYDLGISYHWTDLGEPEMYDEGSCYFGFPELKKHRHGDIHNIYNLKWIESIARGYEHNNNRRRPFSMTRSGTIGVGRYGAAMWSGDIGANMGALTAHYQAQMHVTYSGIDYFGSDIGGFHRRPDTLDGDPNELYTQWFANAALFDFPVRAHTWNLSNQLETSPSKIGDFKSNLFNLKLRYKLMPYYYSLAHRAHREGLPVISPMPLEFPSDLAVRKMGNQKMIGTSLMAAISARYGEGSRNVYLPVGEWVDLHTGARYKSSGEYVYNIKVNDGGIFRLPLFAREGAIIPMMKELSERSNISGKMFDGSYNHDLLVTIFPSNNKSSFTLIEDDGQTVDYKNQRLSETVMTQHQAGNKIEIMLAETAGDYDFMPGSREYQLAVYVNKDVKAVKLNGKEIEFKLQNGILKTNLGVHSQRSEKNVEIELK